MLPKADRLSKKEFDLVIKTGREAVSPFFSLKYIPETRFKFSSVAPKKTFKTAVSRNNTRRRIYSIMRHIARTKKIKPSFSILVVKKDIKSLDSIHITASIDRLFVQAGLIA